MFGLVTTTLSAVNQVGAFFGALVCWGLGGLLVGNAIYWRVHALRVQGEVIGVRRSGNCLNSVYRYVLPSGETCEATSTEGSSSMRGRETGTQVPLWVIPEKPHEVQERSSHVFTVVGMGLLGMGAVFFWVGATTFRTGPMTWVVALLFVAHLLHRTWKVIAPIVTPQDKSLRQLGWRELLKAAQARQAATAASSPAATIQQVEDLASLPGIQTKVIRRRANPRALAPFLLLAGVGLLALGVHQSRALLRLEATGTRAPGMVTALSSSSSGNGGITYHPVVTFTDAQGKQVTFRDSTGTNPPLYHVGQSVTVMYLPSEVGRAVIDRGVWNWLPSALLYLLGGALLAAGLAALKTQSAADADPLAPGATP